MNSPHMLAVLQDWSSGDEVSREENGGVILLEACHLERALSFQKPRLEPVSMSCPVKPSFKGEEI